MIYIDLPTIDTTAAPWTRGPTISVSVRDVEAVSDRQLYGHDKKQKQGATLHLTSGKEIDVFDSRPTVVELLTMIRELAHDEEEEERQARQVHRADADAYNES